MSKSEIVRAWKNPRFRADLGNAGHAAMASSPVRAMGLGEDQLRRAARTSQLTTAWFCTLNTMFPSCQ